jgi:toxin FitB
VPGGPSCVMLQQDPAQAENFEHRFSQLTDCYRDRIVPITAQIAEVWGRLNVPDPVLVVMA